MKSYRDLGVYQKSYELSREIHTVTIKLPKYEMFELGSQVRRSSQSIRSNIVEGYGRRYYKQEYIRFLYIAYASLLETISHLEMLFDLYKFPELIKLRDQYIILGKQLHRFIQSIYINHKPTI